MSHQLSSNNGYKLFSADIRDTDKLGEKLAQFGVDTTVPTLFLTECVLVYLKPEESKKILTFIKEHFTGDTALLNYEMINPSDPFGRMMVENLEVTLSLLIFTTLGPWL